MLAQRSRSPYFPAFAVFSSAYFLQNIPCKYTLTLLYSKTIPAKCQLKETQKKLLKKFLSEASLYNSNHRKCQKAHSGIVSSPQGLRQARTLARRLYNKTDLGRLSSIRVTPNLFCCIHFFFFLKSYDSLERLPFFERVLL